MVEIVIKKPRAWCTEFVGLRLTEWVKGKRGGNIIAPAMSIKEYTSKEFIEKYDLKCDGTPYLVIPQWKGRVGNKVLRAASPTLKRFVLRKDGDSIRIVSIEKINLNHIIMEEDEETQN